MNRQPLFLMAGLLAALIGTLILAFGILGNPAAAATQRTRPTLFIVHAEWCLPCRVFDTTFSKYQDFRTALQNAAELRALHW